MKSFFISIAASIIAGVVLLYIPQFAKLFMTNDVFLNVQVSKEQFNNLNISRVIAQNESDYAFKPLNFIVESKGTILRIAVRKSNGSVIVLNDLPKMRTIPLVLCAREAVEVIEVSDGGAITTEVKQLFKGKYSFVGSNGMIEEKDIKVRTMSEAQSSRYVYLAKIIGFFILLVSLASFCLLMHRLRKKKLSESISTQA